MKTRSVKFMNKTYTVIVDDEDDIENLKLYVNNVEGTLRVMYMCEKGYQSRLDKKLRGFSCRPKNGDAFDLRAENCEPRDRRKEYAKRYR